MKGKIVVLLSGGMDSTTLLYLAIKKFGKQNVKALSVYYGQRHAVETGHALAICEKLGILLNNANLGNFGYIITNNALTGQQEVPEGHYQEETMKATVVPNRNMILLAIATAYAIDNGCDYVAYACHSGDHAIYPDCRPEFVKYMRKAMGLCHFTPVKLYVPFLNKDKTYIAKMGMKLKVPFEMTWSCYKGQDKHCGKCGTCVERKEAFKLANVEDVTNYEGE